MRKKMIAGAVLALAMMCGCGGSGKTEAPGGSAASDAGAAGVQESAGPDGEAGQTEESNTSGVELKGYLFVYKDTKVSVDHNMAPILEALGEPKSYFESASCAFEGLDKIYTYSDFEIDTYPQGDQDFVSAILLKSDLVTTAEGVYVGSSLEDVTAAYGSDYAEEAGMIVYRKEGMKLCFIVQNNEVTSIQYLSTVLNE